MTRVKRTEHEKGAALIIVLGLVALIGAWASTTAYEDMLSLRRAENMTDAMRAGQASQSAFSLALKVLREDAQETQQDNLEEYWAQETTAFPVDQGTVSAEIIDTNRFINLNDLVNSQDVVQPEVELSLKLLFQRLELDSALVDRLVDWIDLNDTPYGAAGAEDSAYYDLTYRVKNGPLERWSELRMIKGFDDDVVAKLEPFIISRAPSTSGMVPINVNTASPEVLMALFPKMTAADAEVFIGERPYSAITLTQPWAQGVNYQGRVSTTSDLFIVRTDARFGRVVLREEFMVSRKGQDLRLVSRQRLEWNRGLKKEVGKL